MCLCSNTGFAYFEKMNSWECVPLYHCTTVPLYHCTQHGFPPSLCLSGILYKSRSRCFCVSGIVLFGIVMASNYFLKIRQCGFCVSS